nr:VWA-like domain-containing protein [uncultured Oribacterium sp.]
MKGKREERRPTAQGSLNDLGSRILNQSRYELSLSMRHLARALDRLPYEMDFNTQRMGTEGERIHFHPEFIFQLFMESPQKLNRLYMHSLLHCLFRHMFKNEDKKEELWNMACDIHVEYVLDSLDVDLLKRPAGEYRENTFQSMEEKIKTLSAERIYQYLEEEDLDYDAWERLEREFYKDDHVFWKVIDREDAPGQEGEGDGDGAPLPMPEDFTPNDNPSGEENEGEKKDSGDNTSVQNSEDKDKSPRESKSSEDASPQSGTPSNGEGKEEKNQEAGNQEPENRGSEGEGNTGEGNSGEDSQGEAKQEDSQSGNSSGKKQEERKKAENRKPTGQGQREEREAKKKRDDLSKEWEDISKRTEQEIEHSSKEKQEEQGSLAWFLRLEQKKYTDFRDFLRRLSVDREEMEVDLDSFDYGYYYYGLEQYGNMPLIEENEYREGRKLQELVIAIDTSHSTKGEMVKGFLEETAGILKQKDAFFQKVKVHILECDDELRKDICLENVEDLEQYSKNFAVKGGYGTDFRPVFRYVSDLQKRGELKNLKGLMYFTDGKGRYPKEAPPYVTAFVFPKGEDIDDDNVPFWAMKLYQREKD